MSGPSSRNPRPGSLTDNGQMLLLGTQCAESHCLQVDFLPFRCLHCSKSYCQTHYKVEDHKCPEYEEYRHNRVAPDCTHTVISLLRIRRYSLSLLFVQGPFCNVPVAVPPDQDPNIRMELHFEKECAVILGEVPPRPTPRCSKVVCNKVLFSPIACPVRFFPTTA